MTVASSPPIFRVGIVEDNFNMRAHFSRVVERALGLDLVFAAETLAEAKAMSGEKALDICLVDLQLPDGSGLEFVAHLRDHTDAKALILTVLGDKVSVLAGLQAGAQGYLLKDTTPAQIEHAIQSAMAGANPISPQAATHLLSILNVPKVRATPQVPKDKENQITEREKDVLTMFSRGLSYQETADVLNISLNTVREYTKTIYRKLKVHSRNEAIFEAVQNNWIDLN
jgi:DNA-binding NarL/FixJ family response regulator